MVWWSSTTLARRVRRRWSLFSEGRLACQTMCCDVMTYILCTDARLYYSSLLLFTESGSQEKHSECTSCIHLTTVLHGSTDASTDALGRRPFEKRLSSHFRKNSRRELLFQCENVKRVATLTRTLFVTMHGRRHRCSWYSLGRTIYRQRKMVVARIFYYYLR